MKVPGLLLGTGNGDGEKTRKVQQKNVPRSHRTEDDYGNYSLRSGPPSRTRPRSNLNRRMRDMTSTPAIYSVTHEYTFLPTATVF